MRTGAKFLIMETCQICTHKDGWRKCENPVLLQFEDRCAAIGYLQVLANNLNSEVRGALVTGFEKLISRNRSGEKLGNGIYVFPKS